jgi:hypothetical protein
VQGEHGASSWFMVPIAIVKEEQDLRHTENTIACTIKICILLLSSQSV